MIDRQALLSDLTRVLAWLRNDLRARCDTHPNIDAVGRAEWQRARGAGRTAEDYKVWREDWITQGAAAWILGTVFVRFMEDNGLIATPQVSGPRDRLAIARDCRTLYFNGHPTDSDREYLLHVFETVGALPAAAHIFDSRHNPIWKLGPTGDAATRLLEFWQRIHPSSGVLGHDFTDKNLDTRFLGDLYEDLSDDAKVKYALLQTPVFVEEFILDRTLTPAIEEFGYREVRLIDPACGSGHFLLGAFSRLLDISQRNEPSANVRELVRRALDNVYGVDVNPFAVAIARFRLLVAALSACKITHLDQAPAFPLNVYTGDSLLHGRGFTNENGLQVPLDEEHPVRQALAVEDAEALGRVLGQQYHAVVGNPPYITVKDKALNQAYRQRYGSCHRQYSLAVPFTERFFELALPNERAGFVGMITANSFMKREFGKKLIEKYIPRWDLTHVIDTSGAYIPGHGTPTVILLGRNRQPVASTVRAVLGIRGEPRTPDDPSRGQAWSAITDQVEHPGSESGFVSVADLPRQRFQEHPWSIGGGGASDLKERLQGRAAGKLSERIADIGRTTHTGEDDVYYLTCSAASTRRLLQECVPLVQGEEVRDYAISPGLVTVFPYEKADGARSSSMSAPLRHHFWGFRTTLKNRLDFGQTPEERGLRWFDHSMFFRERFRTPLSIAFAFVATHNHFVLDRGGNVFKQTAPVIKLPPDATEDDHLALLGFLNSSTACFWMKQTFFDRGNGGIGGGIASEEWERFFEHDGTKLRAYPIPESAIPLDIARSLDALGNQIVRSTLGLSSWHANGDRLAEVCSAARDVAAAARSRAIALQEELDWQAYRAYGVTTDNLSYRAGQPPCLTLGQRAFEIVMARKMAAGELETTWFERHGSAPITDIPSHWTEEYRRLVERRIAEIESNKWTGLIEQPEYKRRWNAEPWEHQLERSLRSWLLERLETLAYWPSVELSTCAQLAQRAKHDKEFMEVADVYRGHADFDVVKLVTELVLDEAVPYLPALRYKESGLRKREAWEHTWELQRREDEIDARPGITPEEAKALKAKEVGDIPVPPKYTSADFKSSTFWRLRGKLDVPKERFVSYPGASRENDPSPVVAWVGWDHLQQAQALSAYYLLVKEQDGWAAERLRPLLAGLRELLPWLKQWHNEVDADTGLRLGDYFADFTDAQERALGARV